MNGLMMNSHQDWGLGCKGRKLDNGKSCGGGGCCFFFKRYPMVDDMMCKLEKVFGWEIRIKTFYQFSKYLVQVPIGVFIPRI